MLGQSVGSKPVCEPSPAAATQLWRWPHIAAMHVTRGTWLTFIDCSPLLCMSEICLRTIYITHVNRVHAMRHFNFVGRQEAGSASVIMSALRADYLVKIQS